MVKRAVLVGCNYPGSQAALNGCVNDVKAIREVLLKHKGFLEKDITVMIDTDPAAIQPTGKNIRHALKEMVAATKPGDVIFFHFSGHGTQVPSSSGEADGKDEAICPTDMNLIIDNDLREIFEHVDKGADLTVICDCCHSGGLLDHTTVQIGEGDNQKGPPPGVNMSGFLSMLTGGGGAAPAPQQQQQQGGGGMGMGSLLGALAGASQPQKPPQQQQQAGGMGALLGALAGGGAPQQQQQYPPQQQQAGGMGGMGSLLGALAGGGAPQQQHPPQQQGGMGAMGLLGALAGGSGGGQSAGGMGGLGAMMGMLGGGGGGGGFGMGSLLSMMLANSVPARDVNLAPRSLPIQTVCQILGQNSHSTRDIAPTDLRQALADIFQKSATPSVRGLAAPQGCIGVVMRMLMGGGSNQGSQTHMGAPAPAGGAAAIDPSDPIAGLATLGPAQGAGAAAGSSARGRETTVLVSGCESHQTSADACPSGNPAKAFGALTNSLCTVINQNPDVSAYELVAASRQLLGQGGYSQRPTLECENGIAARPFICATIHSV